MGNTPTRFNRFKDAAWFPKEQTEVIVGGAGGIGSWLTLLLTRAGFEPIVYDFDRYEEHNMSGQLCKASDINKLKVDALADTVKEFTTHTIITMNEKYDSYSPTHQYVFAGFDNIEGRKMMFQSWRLNFGKDPQAIFIDGRLTLEQLQIFCIKGGDEESQQWYQNECLFNDAEVAEAACTLKQTSHTAAMIASHMVAFFTNHMNNVVDPSAGRAVPKRWEYFTPIDYLDT